MQQYNTSASLALVPYEVLHYHIIRFLSLADLLITSMTCKALRKLIIKSLDKQKVSKFQQGLLDEGSFEQLVWFQENLKYLSKTELNQKKQILVAFEGEKCFIRLVILFITNVLIRYFYMYLGGNLALLCGLLAAGYEIPTTNAVLCKAAFRGHLEVLKWAYANGCTRNADICSSAARGGHLEVLKWARANGYQWNIWSCVHAAAGGHLEVLKWAHKNGCEWNSGICSVAAERGHLEVLQWARANGCEWSVWTCAGAALAGHLTILQWAYKWLRMG